MNQYADQTFYTGTYLQGRTPIITAAYDYYFREASRRIDGVIINGDPESYEEVKCCCCEIGELLYSYEADTSAIKASGGSGKTSESVQGWSVSYQSKQERTAQLNTDITAAIAKWLTGTGLLYQGVGSC